MSYLVRHHCRHKIKAPRIILWIQEEKTFLRRDVDGAA
jgi:hypothetical protein